MTEREGRPDAARFSALVEPQLDAVLAYLTRSVGQPDDARDLLQETLIKAWNGFAGYSERGQGAGWLFTIARRALIDWTRGRPPRSTAPERLAMVADPASNPHDETVAREMERVLLDAIRELPETRRTVFLMRQHSSMTFQQIADELGMPLGTALGHVHQTIKALRAALAPFDIAQSGGSE